MKDAYEQFFALLSKEKFFKFGLDNLITIEPSKARNEWEDLKSRVARKDSGLYVRSSGRHGRGNNIIQNLYQDIYGIDIKFDLTNNQKPTKVIEKLTGYRKNETIMNYQVSHVFGNTKNVLCFTAPWNIVFIPKIIDPLTGHEAKGGYVEEFRSLFKRKIYVKYKELISDYNKAMKTKERKIKAWIEANIKEERIRRSIAKDFKEIMIGVAD